ncbi:MAG: type I-E CRISPR-associated protein Cse2/CasB [Clostridiales Family XIII bacterium]|jgi:CRISPR system Cascade subunit CasB|nr:type I-E CRISPR-associated protein Cse2/CasB [Clostridiales Family XIII bacterium]
MDDVERIIRKSVANTIGRLTKPGQGERSDKFTSWGTAMLAKLRRAAGAPPDESADVWELTIGMLPRGLAERDRERALWAVHTALTLFAIHQQSRRRSINRTGVGFGKAVQRIFITSEGPSKKLNEGVRRRFGALATSLEFKELSRHARDLVQLLRAKDVGFDYPLFAAELYRYQLGPEQRERVRMRWGMDFYAFGKEEQNTDV